MVDHVQNLETTSEAPGLDLKERALEYAATAREQFAGGSQFLREYIVKQPTRALGIALGTGVLLGWLIKRR